MIRHLSTGASEIAHLLAITAPRRTSLDWSSAWEFLGLDPDRAPVDEKADERASPA
ncbi:hypothetical protein [Neoasaia chiangmaiensis]|uniref:hypothetical protein n=1 Tax=Neoasaia chiangmaiensis TaxID=320497 RepID=UPI0014766FBE|nr:hypothetical protein [Neoasaia chiangmaiensis]